MSKTLYTLILVTLSLLITNPAHAITTGELDGENHPAVVLIVMDVEGPLGNPAPAARCTGTLISPTYVVTAGHCTGAVGEFVGMRVFTESDVDNGDNNFPFEGNNSVEAVNWESHPDYNPYFFIYHDVGMIELEAPGIILNDDQYASLPDVDFLDSFKTKRGQNNTTFTAVGYGVQRINPVFIEAELIRMIATPSLIQINVPGLVGDFSLLLSNNHSTGGTCFGDSGGPNFIGDSLVIGGVTSFAMNGNCAGTGGVFRLDRENVLEFINGFTGL